MIIIYWRRQTSYCISPGLATIEFTVSKLINITTCQIKICILDLHFYIRSPFENTCSIIKHDEAMPVSKDNYRRYWH